MPLHAQSDSMTVTPNMNIPIRSKIPDIIRYVIHYQLTTTGEVPGNKVIVRPPMTAGTLNTKE